MRWRDLWQRVLRFFSPARSAEETSSLPLGQRGEEAAEKFLRAKGYKILARRERSKLGEIDLVARDRGTIVFVEVKTRNSHAKGHPAEAVNEHKQKRLTRLALSYLKRHRLLTQRARFDVVAVTWPESEKTPTIKHYPHAFQATGFDGMYS